MKLKFLCGTMNSAKTAELLMRNHSLRANGLNVALFKSALDDRSGVENISSRIGLEAKADGLIFPETDVTKLMFDFIHQNGTPKLILVDEAQFLNAKQIEDLRFIASTLKIPVSCYGLRTDASSHTFEGSKRLFELCDEIVFFEKYCNCGDFAIINAKIKNGKVVLPEQTIDIGGEEKYEPMCYKCWLEKLNKREGEH